VAAADNCRNVRREPLRMELVSLMRTSTNRKNGYTITKFEGADRIDLTPCADS
jgi:hypothetical protein